MREMYLNLTVQPLLAGYGEGMSDGAQVVGMNQTVVAVSEQFLLSVPVFCPEITPCNVVTSTPWA
jgi:hypothetical protein